MTGGALVVDCAARPCAYCAPESAEARRPLDRLGRLLGANANARAGLCNPRQLSDYGRGQDDVSQRSIAGLSFARQANSMRTPECVFATLFVRNRMNACAAR